MLINQSELQTLCLKQSAVDDLAAQVINQLNGIADPILRYATANTLKQVFEEACKNTGQAAEAFCEKADIGNDGKHFNYAGLCFNRNFEYDYNYAGNDYYEDETGEEHSCGYRQAKKMYDFAVEKYEAAKREKERMKDQLDAVKRTVLRFHPNMVPEVVKIVFRFIGDAEKNAPDETTKGEALLNNPKS